MGLLQASGVPSVPERCWRRACADHRAERGASLIEFALVLPLLVMLMLGMITGGIALDNKQQITHATREGARYAAAIPPNQTFASGTWAENVRDLVIERLGADLASTTVCVSLVQGSPGTVVTPIANYSTATGNGPCIVGQTYPVTANDGGLRVQVTGSKPAKIEFLVSTANITLSAKATAKSEQQL